MTVADVSRIVTCPEPLAATKRASQVTVPTALPSLSPPRCPEVPEKVATVDSARSRGGGCRPPPWDIRASSPRRARTSHSRQLRRSRSIASLIQSRARNSAPASSFTSASCTYGLAAQGWMSRAALACFKAVASSDLPTAAWLLATSRLRDQRDRLGADQHPGYRQRSDPEAEPRPGARVTGDGRRRQFAARRAGAVAGPVTSASEATPTTLTAVSSHIHSKPRLRPYATNTAVSAAVVTPASPGIRQDRRIPTAIPESDDGDDQHEADDPQLAEGFQVERVGVPDEVRETKRAAPTSSRTSLLRRRGPDVSVPLVESGRPELPATAATPAQQVRLDEVSVARREVGARQRLEPFDPRSWIGRHDPDERQDEGGDHDDASPPAPESQRLSSRCTPSP